MLTGNKIESKLIYGYVKQTSRKLWGKKKPKQLNSSTVEMGGFSSLYTKIFKFSSKNA